MPTAKTVLMVQGVTVIGDVWDFRGMDLCDRSTEPDTTEEYFEGVKLVLSTYHNDEWFDPGTVIRLYSKTKEEFIDLYKLFIDQERYRVSFELDPSKQIELLERLLALS